MDEKLVLFMFQLDFEVGVDSNFNLQCYLELKFDFLKTLSLIWKIIDDEQFINSSMLSLT